MKPCILLVDDQRNIVHLLHSTLNTMGHELEVIEAPSGEEAILAASRHHVDLLVADYLLPGMTGIELVHKIRARNPDVKVILISGLLERRAREQMLNAGAVAVFNKPIPLADFLDVVERSLGLTRIIFPPETEDKAVAKQSRLSELLANFRQDLDAHAVFLLNDRGRVLARAGALRDSSMEVSLLSALTAIYTAGLKVSRFIHQDQLENFHIFPGGDQDLLFIPVDSTYSLMVAGRDLSDNGRVLEVIQSTRALRDHVERALTNLGVTAPLVPADEIAQLSKKAKGKTDDPAVSPEMDDLLKKAGSQKLKTEEMNDFWDQAAEKHGKLPADPDALSYEQARKMGLLPGEEK
ncbi:MAG TPA: response regulator [Anaerolineales bacterium]